MKKQKNRFPKGSIISWILFAVIIVALLGGLLWWQRVKEQLPLDDSVSESDTTTETRKPFAVETLTDEEKALRDQANLGSALNQGTVEACEKIEFDPILRQKCIDSINFAVFSRGGNEKLCDGISDTDLKIDCFDQVYYSAATDELNLSFCEKITKETLRQNCLQRVQSFLGRIAKTASDCSEITDPTFKKQCLDSFYLASSVNTLNQADCNNITDFSLRDNCVQTVTRNVQVVEASKAQSVRLHATAADMVEDCSKFEGDGASTCSDSANFDLALEKKDLSYCNRIQDKQKQNECLQLQAGNINRFYLKQAISKKDPSLCQKIIDETLQGTCMDYAAN